MKARLETESSVLLSGYFAPLKEMPHTWSWDTMIAVINVHQPLSLECHSRANLISTSGDPPHRRGRRKIGYYRLNKAGYGCSARPINLWERKSQIMVI
ncbi:unnamed protein product [Nezara viridula]|uniref:Uncharacterized protein n=1 Tax=Nezara viridula TaxID=85310 RepID=A0A9P0MQB9_NEZVI|nr:unnamed protein product [Nezara viridula]